MTSITDKLGVNDYGMYFNNNLDYEMFKSNWDYDMQMMSRLPIKWVRIGYGYWEANINPDGSFNFDRLDYAINSALDNGFKIIFPFFFTNNGYKTPVSFEKGINDLKSLIKAVVIRYAGKGIYYEGINEINGINLYFIDNALMDHIDEAVALNEYFFATTKEYDTSSTYIAGALALAENSHYDKFQELVKRGYFNHGSYGSYHQYVMGEPEKGLTNYLHDQDVINYFKSKYGKLSITEIGYGSPSNFNGSYTRQQQSDFTLRQIFLLDMIGAEHIIYFTMDNSDKTWALQENYYDAGIYKGKTPSFNLVGNKLQELFTELYGYSFKTRIETDPNDFYLLYKKDGGVDKLVYWTASGSHVANGLSITSTPQIINFNEATSDNTTDQVGSYYIKPDVLGKQTIVSYDLTLDTDMQSGSTISLQVYDYAGNWDRFSQQTGLKAGTTHVSVSWKAPEKNGSGNLYLRGISDDYTGKITISNFSVMLGNVATDWTPAPEDVPSNDVQLVHKTGPETIDGDKKFTSPINGALATRAPAFTDFNDVARNMTKYSGSWAIGLQSIANSPLSNYYTATITPGFSDGANGYIEVVPFALGSAKKYIAVVGSGKLSAWKLFAFDDDVVHKTGTETIAGDKKFTSNTTLATTTILAGNYGLRVTPSGFQKTTDGTTWVSVNF